MKKRFRSFKVEEKISVVDWHRQNGSVVSKTASKYKIDRKCVRDWNRKYEHLKWYEATPKGKKARKMHDGCEPMSPQLDDRVYEFLQERQRCGLAVSNMTLTNEARRVGADLGIVEFKASGGWLNNWKKRYNVRLRLKKSESQAVAEDCKDAVQRQNIPLQMVGSYCNAADEEEMMDSVAYSSNNVRGEKIARCSSLQ